MKTKNENVNLDLNIMLLVALKYIEKAAQKIEGSCYQVTITSAKDGSHMKNSKHYVGLAIDIRTKDMKSPNLVLIEIKKVLGGLYDVVLEPDHIHIEFDPKGY